MRVAAIDLGTNSFLCLVAEVSGQSPSASLSVIEDLCRVVRVGEQVHKNRYFLPEALRRAETCLDEFQGVIQKHKVDKVIATATSAARDASNGSSLIKLGQDRGMPIHVIGGSKEAELSFEGAVSAVPDAYKKSILVVDVGGGSTELIYRQRSASSDLAATPNPIKARSFDVGCVRLTEMFLKKDPVDMNELQELRNYATKEMSGFGQVKPDEVIAVAGTPTTLACVAQKIDFDEQKVEGFKLNRQQINAMASRLGAMPMNERKKVKGLEPLRADVIVAGCVLLHCALDLAGGDKMRVSTRGLRYGVALRHGDFN